MAAIAYIDPGNFATNITAGSQFGYLLIWVLVVSNLMAMLIQYLSAKAGIATGKNLPELCRDNFPKPVTRGLWVQAELVAIATDLAEVLGGAIALQLLFGLPLLVGGVITAVVAFALLGLQTRGARPFEVAITGMLLVVLVGFLLQPGARRRRRRGRSRRAGPALRGHRDRAAGDRHAGRDRDAARHLPARRPHPESLRAQHRGGAAGAAAQPTGGRGGRDGYRRLDQHRRCCAVAAQSLSNLPVPVDTIEGAYEGLAVTLGPTAALLFGLALLASGFAASGVGTFSGQVVMQGFLRRRIPLVVRRLVTLAPALVVIAAGVDTTAALVISQVVLSFGIPFALIPLVLLTRRRDVMGALVNRRLTTFVAAVVAAVICCLNVTLIALTVAG